MNKVYHKHDLNGGGVCRRCGKRRPWNSRFRGVHLPGITNDKIRKEFFGEGWDEYRCYPKEQK